MCVAHKLRRPPRGVGTSVRRPRGASSAARGSQPPNSRSKGVVVPTAVPLFPVGIGGFCHRYEGWFALWSGRENWRNTNTGEWERTFAVITVPSKRTGRLNTQSDACDPQAREL
jgi:hypothetical protein